MLSVKRQPIATDVDNIIYNLARHQCTDAKSDNLVWQRSPSLILMVLEPQ